MPKKSHPERHGSKKQVNEEVVAHFTSENPSSKKRLRKLAEVNHQEELVDPIEHGDESEEEEGEARGKEGTEQYHQFGIKEGEDVEDNKKSTMLDKFIASKQKKETKKKKKQPQIPSNQLTLMEINRIKKEKQEKRKLRDLFLANDSDSLEFENPEPSPALQQYKEVNGSIEDQQKLIEYAKKMSLQEQPSPIKSLLSKKEDIKKDQKKEQKKEEKEGKKEGKKEKRGKSKGKMESEQHHGPLAGYVIAFTGEFQQYQKDEVIEVCMQLGAICPKSLVKKCNLLIQGSFTMDHFKRKLSTPVGETAKSLQAKQRNIEIIPPEELQDFFMGKTGSSLQELLDKNKGKPVQITQYFQRPNPEQPSINNEKVEPIEVEQQILKKPTNTQLWTDKYKPTHLGQISGHNSQLRLLKEWLSTWEDVHIRGLSPNFKEMKGDSLKTAALVSGDPGIGKTTAARLIAAELNFAVTQFNASDVRNKSGVNLMEIGSYNLDIAKNLQKSVIIMDEVDGMSSGDRGGITAIIQLIKNTKVPIICICNDRSSEKIRSLSNHCLSIPFHKPLKGTIVKRLKEILHEEGGNGEERALELLVETFNNDMRQILSYLELIFKTVSSHITLNTLGNRSKYAKDSSVMINHFAAARTLLNRHDFSGLKIPQRTELFFVDSDLVPLLVHQNLLSTKRNNMNLRQIHSLTQGYKGMVLGDMLDKDIRKKQEWGLMPAYGFMSCVYPTQKISDTCGYPQFPAWLGKNSSQRKNKRLVREVKNMLFPQTFCSSNRAIRRQYLIVLVEELLDYLKHDNFESALQMMEHYNLTPSVLNEHLTTLTTGRDKTSPFGSVGAPVKSKLTRLFNKRHEDAKLKQQKVKRGGEKHIKVDPVLQEAQFEDEAEEQMVEEEVIKPEKKKGKKK